MNVTISETEFLKLRFQQVYKGRPGALRTTFFYGPGGWIIRILGWLTLILGLGLIISGCTGRFVFEQSHIPREQLELLAAV